MIQGTEGTAIRSAFKTWISGTQTISDEFEIFQAGWLASQSPAAGVWEGKYSWEKIEDQYQVRHKEGKEDTFIAKTDSAEKAHFLAYAANFLSSGEYGSGQEQGQAVEIARLKFLIEILVNGQSQSTALTWTKNIGKIREYMEEQWQLFKSENNL